MTAYIIESGALLSLFYSFLILFMRKTTFFKLNRIIFTAGTVLCLVIPLVNFDVKLIRESDILPIINIEAAIAGTGQETELKAEGFDLQRVSGIIYWIGAFTVLSLTAVSLARTAKMIKGSHPVKSGKYRTGITEAPSFSFLNYLIINKDDYENFPEVTVHELAHINHWHSADLLFFSLVTILHWFNPLIWIARNELKMLHEYEADEEVIKKGTDAAKYQLLLVKKAVGAERFQLANSFNHSKLKKRITMMQAKKTNKWMRLSYLGLIPTMLIGFCFYSNRGNSENSQSDNGNLNEVAVVAYKTENNDAAVQRTSDENPIPFNEIDTKPSFDGGEIINFSKWLNTQLVYPQSAKDAGVQGKVTATFKVNADGSVSDIKIIKGVCSAIDNEVIRVIGLSPKWTPGKENGKEVACSMLIPVIFKLR